ncbi:MAG: hypothetical protein WBG32_09895, partial [Nodosilinea sp.]
MPSQPPDSLSQGGPNGDSAAFELVDMTTALNRSADATSARSAARPTKWGCSQVLTGHSSWVRALAVSADGNFI